MLHAGGRAESTSEASEGADAGPPVPKPEVGSVKRARVKLYSSQEELVEFQIRTAHSLETNIYMADGEPMCTTARNMIVQRSQCWMDHHGGPKRRVVDATPVTEEDLLSTSCCAGNCWKQRSMAHARTLIAFSERAHAAQGVNGRREVLEALTIKAPHLCVNARSILCNLDPRTIDATDARFAHELQTGDENNFVHGNTGLEPVNRLDAALIAKIELTINK